MHGYNNLYGSGLNEFSFIDLKLLMHGNTFLHGGDLNEDEHFEEGTLFILSSGIEGLT